MIFKDQTGSVRVLMVLLIAAVPINIFPLILTGFRS